MELLQLLAQDGAVARREVLGKLVRRARRPGDCARPVDLRRVHAQHNTPSQPDGEQAFWIDGKLLGHWKGINWRKTDSLQANALTLESYITDRWTKNPTNVVFFDNVVIARRYIGPAGREASP